MTDSTRFIGPRGWAALVLAGGAALSAPFLQKPGKVPDSEDSSADIPGSVDFSNHTWPDLREKALTPPGQVTTHLSEQDWADLARLQNNSGAMPRKLTGDLPSTSGSPLPSWADRGPRIDQLVNDSIRTEPLAPAAPVASSEIEPLRPWMGRGMNPIAEPQTAAPQTGDLQGDFAIASSHPDTRWSNVPSTTINADPTPRDVGGLARNQPMRKFEDKVKQWPDEKSSSSQMAGAAPAPQMDRYASGPHPTWPSQSQPAQPAPIVDEIIKPESVSAPMVSAQSPRPAPRLSPPRIEAAQPSTSQPPPPRVKHFIQQPTKRA